MPRSRRASVRGPASLARARREPRPDQLTVAAHFANAVIRDRLHGPVVQLRLEPESGFRDDAIERQPHETQLAAVEVSQLELARAELVVPLDAREQLVDRHHQKATFPP
jgi:hypothetical protein